MRLKALHSIILSLLCLLLALVSNAQSSSDRYNGYGYLKTVKPKLNIDSLPDLTVPSKREELKKMKAEEKKTEFKQKRVKRKVFYGRKTKRAFAKKGAGKRMTVEYFFVLKKFERPDPNVEEVWWYDVRKKKLTNRAMLDKDVPFALIPHGPYKKYVDTLLVESGVFYVGTKHARWMKYDGRGDLESKIKYNKGYTRESILSYYDREETKIKEVVPIQDSLKHGRYIKYFKDGAIEVEGEYQYGRRVGLWKYYHSEKYHNRKKHVQYPKKWYEETEPFTLREFNERGKLTYQHESDKKRR